MPNPSIVRFDYDSTGVNPDNLVSNEIHALTDNFVRAFAPTYGPFFADSVVLFDNANDRQLIRGTDYSITELNQDITLRLGKEVSSVVLVLNASISNAVRMTYQVVGGLYQNQASAIANMYTTLLHDNRPIDWANILGKPLSFPPTIHLHNLEDVYGFEPVVNAIERIRSAIILSDVPAFEALVDWVNGQLSGLSGSATNNSTLVTNLSNTISSLTTNVNNLTTNVTNLTTTTNTEITNRVSGDNTLSGLLTTEIANRIAADNTLSGLLTTEIANRIAADNTKVTQGGGVGQLNNVVKMGWATNSRLKVTVDNVDLGNVVFDGQLTSALGNYLPISGGALTGVLVSDALDTGTANADSDAAIQVRNNGSTGNSGAASLSFLCSGTYGIKLYLRADGYFGLGGWSRAAWSWYSDPNGNMVAAGNIGAYSDPRLKENFSEIDDPFAVINEITGYTFNWNNRSKLIQNKWGKLDVGFKATDVKRVLPLAVSAAMRDEENDETYDLVAYDKLIPYHNEALKRLQARIDALENKMSIVDKAMNQYKSAKDKVKNFILQKLNR